MESVYVFCFETAGTLKKKDFLNNGFYLVHNILVKPDYSFNQLWRSIFLKSILKVSLVLF